MLYDIIGMRRILCESQKRHMFLCVIFENYQKPITLYAHHSQNPIKYYVKHRKIIFFSF